MPVRLNGKIFSILLAVFAGSLLPAQFATNSALANELNSTTLTGAISYSVGSLFLFILLTIQPLKPDWQAGAALGLVGRGCW
jgi:bacterial/archaeal transporter family-2 protein